MAVPNITIPDATDGPPVFWNVGESLPFRLSISVGTDAQGLPAQAKVSNAKFWLVDPAGNSVIGDAAGVPPSEILTDPAQEQSIGHLINVALTPLLWYKGVWDFNLQAADDAAQPEGAERHYRRARYLQVR